MNKASNRVVCTEYGYEFADPSRHETCTWCGYTRRNRAIGRNDRFSSSLPSPTTFAHLRHKVYKGLFVQIDKLFYISTLSISVISCSVVESPILMAPVGQAALHTPHRLHLRSSITDTIPLLDSAILMAS